MTILRVDGFDMYNGTTSGAGLLSKWAFFSADGGSSSISMSTGRLGGQALYLTPLSFAGGSYAKAGLIFHATSTNTISFGVAFKATRLDNNTTVGRFIEIGYNFDNNIQCGIGLTNLGTIYAYRGAGSTTLATGTLGAISASTWHYIEAEIVLHLTVGSINVYVNGNSVLSVSGVNTLGVGSGGGNILNLGAYFLGPGQGTGMTYAFDDLYITDTATKLGECRVETLRPDSDYSLAWSPDTGSVNYSRVNETLVDNTNYVTTNTISNRDLYGMSNLSSNPVAVFAVNAVSFAKKTDATTRTLSNSIQSNGVDAFGTSQFLSLSTVRYDNIYPLNPDGSVAWTYSAVNAIKAGPKLIS